MELSKRVIDSSAHLLSLLLPLLLFSEAFDDLFHFKSLFLDQFWDVASLVWCFLDDVLFNNLRLYVWKPLLHKLLHWVFLTSFSQRSLDAITWFDTREIWIDGCKLTLCLFKSFASCSFAALVTRIGEFVDSIWILVSPKAAKTDIPPL